MASRTQAFSAGVTVMASMVRDRLVPWYWPTNPSPWSQPAKAASATACREISPSPKDSVRCHSSLSPAWSSPAGTNRPDASPLERHTRWSAVTSSW